VSYHTSKLQKPDKYRKLHT